MQEQTESSYQQLQKRYTLHVLSGVRLQHAQEQFCEALTPSWCDVHLGHRRSTIYCAIWQWLLGVKCVLGYQDTQTTFSTFKLQCCSVMIQIWAVDAAPSRQTRTISEWHPL